MKRSLDRILTTHVGSLVRPKQITDLGNWAAGPPKDLKAYHKVVHGAVAEVVRKQVQVGVDIINDGEFGKVSWADYVLDRLSGFEKRPNQRIKVEWMGRDAQRFPDVIEREMPGYTTGGMPVEACVGPIKYKDHESVQRNVADLKAALESVKGKFEEAFLTAVAPGSTAYCGVDEYYSNERDRLFAIGEALREEYLAIHRAGLLVQVDDAVLANMYDALVQKSPQQYREWAQLRVDVLNHALRDIPEDRIRYHVCFGSWHVPHVADAPLEDIVDFILKVRAAAYCIEAANPRHEHEWRVWEKVKLPPEKILVPGVVTHHMITVEHPRVVADRLIRYARIVGRENVIAGTDCGFAQLDVIQRVPETVVWAKLEALAEGARIATRELWGK